MIIVGTKEKTGISVKKTPLIGSLWFKISSKDTQLIDIQLLFVAPPIRYTFPAPGDSQVLLTIPE